MASLEELSTTLPKRLATLASEHGVVGASMAVQQGDRLFEAATGLTNARTAVEATPDTIFQIGSITKVYTATLVMQLVDEDLVDLDDRVSEHIDGFALADESAAQTVTVRELLTHTSGIDGDFFDDFGRDAECVERYVAAMSRLDRRSTPGTFSYCNSGFVLLGRLVEKLRGLSWDAALREHVLRPLDASDTVTLADEAILRSVAVGHLPTGPQGAPQVAPTWFLPRAVGPAGAITAPAREVLAFARMHIDNGRTRGGTQILSAASAKAMRELQVELPEGLVIGEGWGFGWALHRLVTPKILGHDGATTGQQAFLRVVPERDLAVVLLTTGGRAGALFGDLVRPLLEDLANVALPEYAVPPAEPVKLDASPFLGEFGHSGVRVLVTSDSEGRLWFRAGTPAQAAGGAIDGPVREVCVLDETTLITSQRDPVVGRHITLKFLDLGHRGFETLHFGGRATPRVAR